MSTMLGSLNVDVMANASRVDPTLARAEASVNRSFRSMATGADRVTAAYRRVEAAAGGIRTAVAAMGTALAVRQMATLGSSALENANALNDMRQTLGKTAETLQRYRFAALEVGIAQSEFDNNLTRFTRRLGLAREGTGALARVARELNLDLSNSNTAFRQVGDAIGSANDAADAARFADAAFGRFGVAMGRLFTEGLQGFDEMAARADALGAVIGDDMVSAAADANTNLTMLRAAMRTAFDAGILGPIIGRVDDLETALEEMIPLARQWGDLAGRGLTTVADAAAWAARNMDLLQAAGTAFIGLRIGASFGPIGAGIGLATGGVIALVNAMDDAGPDVTEFGETMSVVSRLQREFAETSRMAQSAVGAVGEAAADAARDAEQALIDITGATIAMRESIRTTVDTMRSMDTASGIEFPSTPAAERNLAALRDYTRQLEQIRDATTSVEVVEMINLAIGRTEQMAVGSERWIRLYGDRVEEAGEQSSRAAAQTDYMTESLERFQERASAAARTAETLARVDLQSMLDGITAETNAILAGGEALQAYNRDQESARARSEALRLAQEAGLRPLEMIAAGNDAAARATARFNAQLAAQESRAGRRSGGGTSTATDVAAEMERQREAYAATLVDLDRQIAAQERLVAAHGDSAAAVRQAEAYNRAYADAVRLGVEEDKKAVAALQQRQTVLAGLGNQVEVLALQQRLTQDLAAAESGFALIGLTGQQLAEVEARLNVINQLRQMGVDTDSTAAQQMLATAEATAQARWQTEQLSTMVGVAYSGLGNLATTTIMNFEDLGSVALSVLNQIAGALVQFGTNQIFNAIFGPLFGAASSLVGGGGGFGGPGVEIFAGGLGIYHTGYTPGVTAGAAAYRAVDPSVLIGAPRLHGGYQPDGIRANEFAAILHEEEEVLPPDHPRHIFNAGQPDVRPRGGVRGGDVHQHNHFQVGVRQTVREEVLAMLPLIQAAAVQAMLDARQSQPDVFAPPQ